MRTGPRLAFRRRHAVGIRRLNEQNALSDQPVLEKEKPQLPKAAVLWRRRWDSNPRDVLPSTRFRVELVMTTSILLHVRACSYRRLFIISETLQKDKSFFGLLRNFYLTRNASGRYRPSGFWDSVVGLVISRPSYTMTEDEPPSSMDA